MSERPSLKGFPNDYSSEQLTEFYKYYHRNKPKQLVARFALKTLSIVLNPTVTHADEEGLNAHLKNGGVVVVPGAHKDGLDPFAFAAAAGSDETLQLLEEPQPRARIFAKKSLFKNPVLRRAIEWIGAVPVARERDDDTPEGKASRGAAIRFGAQTVAERANLVLFSQDTRGQEFDRSKAKKGAAHIALQGQEQIIADGGTNKDVAIVPFAVEFGHEAPEGFSKAFNGLTLKNIKPAIEWVRHARSAEVYIGEMIPVEGTPEELHENVMDGIEEAIEQMVA